MNERVGTLRFGGFSYSTDQDDIVSASGQSAGLTPQTSLVFQFLASRHDHAVTQQEILDSVWSGSRGGADQLPRCVAQLRKVLGDTDGQILRTMPNQCYMLVADPEGPPAHGAESAEAAQDDAQVLDLSSPSLVSEHRRWREKWKPLLSGFVLLLATVLLGIAYLHRSGAEAEKQAPPSGAEASAPVSDGSGASAGQ